MTRYRLSTRASTLLGILLAALYLCSCSSDETDSQGSSETATAEEVNINVDFEWEVFNGQFVIFRCQPVDSIREKAPSLLSKTEQMYSNITFALQNHNIDTLYFFCFADLRDLLDATGFNFTTVVGDSLFYGYGPIYGKQLTQYVMNEIGQPQYLFMQEGLPIVFDYSGRNFHDMMNARVEEDDFDGVATLVNNDSYSKLEPAKRELEAASLCAFLLTQWGPVNFQQISEFRQVYSAEDDFATAASIYFGASIEEIEDRWLGFLPTQTEAAILQRQQQEGEE